MTAGTPNELLWYAISADGSSFEDGVHGHGVRVYVQQLDHKGSVVVDARWPGSAPFVPAQYWPDTWHQLEWLDAGTARDRFSSLFAFLRAVGVEEPEQVFEREIHRLGNLDLGGARDPVAAGASETRRR